MKPCSKCRAIKPFDLFSKDKAIKDGHKSWCKGCCSMYRKANRAALKASNDLWVASNRAYYNAMLSAWRRANPATDRALKAKRRASKLQATPPWLTQTHLYEMAEIYANCPPGHEVDHIVPLQGATVTGLHVPWNLQYLTVSENRAKSNKLAPMAPPQSPLVPNGAVQ